MEQSDGIYYIPCTVNGMPLKMIFDTGASDVSIALPEALVMVRNGTLTENDIFGTTRYMLANGQITEGTEIILRQIEIGNLILRDIKASVVHEMDAPLLLGQSVLERFGNISINNNNKTLTIYNKSKSKPNRTDFPDVPLNGFYLYTTTLKNTFNQVPLYTIIDEDIEIRTYIRRYDEINVIYDRNEEWVLVNFNGIIGIVEKNTTKPRIR